MYIYGGFGVSPKNVFKKSSKKEENTADSKHSLQNGHCEPFSPSLPGDFCAVGCYISQKGNQIIGLIPWKSEEEAGPQLRIYKWKNKAFSVVFAFLKMYNKDSQGFYVFFCPFFRGIFFMISKYFIQHCFICRPSDFTLPEDAGIEPRTISTSALAFRRSNLSAKSHPHLFPFQSCLLIPLRESATLRESIRKDAQLWSPSRETFLVIKSHRQNFYLTFISTRFSLSVKEVEVLPL